jgi:hypothetical protein
VTRFAAFIAVLITSAAVAALAYAVNAARVPSSTAQTVLTVPPSAGPSVASDPAGASELAATYANVLPRDEGIVRAVAQASRMSTALVRERLSAPRSDDSAAVLRFRLSAPSDIAARRGIDALADQIEREQAAGSGVIAPRSLRPVGRSRELAPSASAPGLVRRGLEYIVLVPTAPGGVDAQIANRLAANYAGLIPEDTSILGRAARRAGLPRDELADHVQVANDANTSLVRVSVTLPDYAKARAAATAIARAVTGGDPATGRIAPSTLEVASSPSARPPQASRNDPLVLAAGALIGCLLGIVAVLVYNSRHPRLTTTERTRDALELPTTDATGAHEALLESLLARWRADGARRVHLLPESAGVEAVTERLAAAFDALGVGDGAVSVRSRAFSDAFEPYAGNGVGSYDVLVTSRGRALAPVRDALVRYESHGGRVRWVLLCDADDGFPVEPAPASDRDREQLGV